MALWYLCDKRDKNIVVSSRVRLARNIKGIPFPCHANAGDLKKVVDMVLEAVAASSLKFEYFAMDKLSDTEKQALVEQHLISPDLAKKGENSGVLIDVGKEISIMINEEDHIRIQCILGGYAINEAFDLADKLDNLLEEKIEFAFDSRLGYLTACPTNTGTAMRASVMLHIPALSMTGNIERMASVARKFGMTVRGIYGEGSSAKGDFYQISNQVTLGYREDEIIDKLKDLTDMTVSREQETREALIKNQEVLIKDKIMRSRGILFNAHTMSGDEMLKLISDVRLGIYMGIISDINKNDIDRMIIELQAANLIKAENKNIGEADRDILRAKKLCELK